MDLFYVGVIFILAVLAVISFTTDCYTSKENIMKVISDRFTKYVLSD